MIAPDGRRLAYGELVAADMLHVQAQPKSKLKDPATFKVMGQPVPRVDIPAKVTGRRGLCPGHAAARHGACARRAAAELWRATDRVRYVAIEKMPGVVKVVRDGNFLAVVASKEFQAIKAMAALVGGREMEGDGESAEAGRSGRVS